MVIFNSYLYVYQRVYPINIPLNHYKIPLNHYNIQRVTHPHLFVLASSVAIRVSSWPSGMWPRRRSERIVMWLKQCHKPHIWECFIAPIYDDLRDGLLY
jgi:hypothetical protein